MQRRFDVQGIAWNTSIRRFSIQSTLTYHLVLGRVNNKFKQLKFEVEFNETKIKIKIIA